MSSGPAWRLPMAPSSALPQSLVSSEQRAVGSLAMIDSIQAVHCEPAKAHTEANTLTQNCSGVHKLGSEPVRPGGKLFQNRVKLSFTAFCFKSFSFFL